MHKLHIVASEETILVWNANILYFLISLFKTGYKFPPMNESSDALFTAETVSNFKNLN